MSPIRCMWLCNHCYNQDIEYSIIPKTPSPPSIWATTDRILVPVVLLFPKCHANGIMQLQHGLSLHPCFFLEAFLKKPDHLFHRVSHSLDFADCIPVVVFNELFCPLCLWKLAVIFRGLIRLGFSLLTGPLCRWW